MITWHDGSIVDIRRSGIRLIPQGDGWATAPAPGGWAGAGDVQPDRIRPATP
ncbi:hypothetical protein ACGFIV_01055 [Sphaerisporangium sp. NPDC049003]|uniref:hypothetical protein n=1 Tax=Sphaerisporangium sp. NPDC049003 TaxID=3364517 RepID=UPI003723F0D8